MLKPSNIAEKMEEQQEEAGKKSKVDFNLGEKLNNLLPEKKGDGQAV